MSLNWKEIDQVLSELPLENSHIQKIRQPDFHTLVFDIYSPGKRFRLLISLTQGKTRLHKIDKAPESEIALQRFAQFLRARIKGGRIIYAGQLGSDRIVELKILRGGEITRLWIRLWGGASNIIAVDEEGVILDACYRRPRRGEVSGGTYLPEEELKAVAAALVTSTAEGGDIKPKKEFSLRFFHEEKEYNTLVEEFYSEKEDSEELEILVGRTRRFLQNREEALKSALDKAEERAEKYADPEGLKQTGDLIMTYLHEIKRGEAWVTLENYYRNNELTRIELDPKLSPEENGEKYYKLAGKAKSGKNRNEDELNNIKNQLKMVKDEEVQLLSAPSLSELKEFLSRIPVQKQEKQKEKIPGLQFNSAGFTLLVGRTAKENDALLRKHVRGNDYWLHTRDFPGAYVFVRVMRGKSVPLNVLLDAGNLALFYSKGRSGGRGELYYTQVKYLRRAKDGKTGLVLPSQEKNLSVTLEQERLDRLQKG
ncbi:MAG: NFACT family protein [Spirochaetales bacterium]|nr:NFACT family protein [Spirochaetales bacterium]